MLDYKKVFSLQPFVLTGSGSYSRINSAGWQVQIWSFGSSILALRILGVETVVETY
jgi:hypothetical protein